MTTTNNTNHTSNHTSTQINKFDQSSLDELKLSFQAFLFEQDITQDKTFYEQKTSEKQFPDIKKITSIIESNKGALTHSNSLYIKYLNFISCRHGNSKD